MMKELPYTKSLVNGVATDEDGNYRFELKKRYYGLLNGNSSVLKGMSPEDVMIKYGDQSGVGLVFKVQIAAYINAINYDTRHLKSLGEIDKIILDDGITRFTIGKYSTLNIANDMKKKVIEKGQEDAFIIIFVNGKRTYLEELINTGIFK